MPNKKKSLGTRTVNLSTDTARKRARTGPELKYKKMTVAQRRKWHKDIKEGNIPLSRGVTYGENVLKKRRAALAKKKAKR